MVHKALNLFNGIRRIEGNEGEFSMTPEEAHRLAHRIRVERVKLGLSAHEVARRAGINVGTVTRLELGQIKEPRPTNLLAIAAVLGIEPADIFMLSSWLPSDDLPSFSPYMRAKYDYLPEEAFIEMQRVFDKMAVKYGSHGPNRGDDEY
jgi:transcriptional regulator with XRE-family HTH domain